MTIRSLFLLLVLSCPGPLRAQEMKFIDISNVERWVFGDGEDDSGTAPFLQFLSDVVDEELVAGNGQAELGIEVREVRELVTELVAQAWFREYLPVTVAFAALHERRDE